MENRHWYELYKQWPKKATKSLGKVLLSIDEKGEALAFDGFHDFAKVVAILDRTRVVFAAANGIMLSGFEHVGANPDGTKKYIFQEWWLIYTDAPPDTLPKEQQS